MSEFSRFDRCRWHGCDASCEDVIEMCWYHFRLVGETFIEKRSVFGAQALAARRAEREAERAVTLASQSDPDDWRRSRSVVYYVRIGDHVKIGYTIHLTTRMSTLRVGKDALLAVEPGWREGEAERHKMFAAERQGRREDFNPSRRLLGHVSAMRAKYGEPYGYAARRQEAAGTPPLTA